MFVIVYVEITLTALYKPEIESMKPNQYLHKDDIKIKFLGKPPELLYEPAAQLSGLERWGLRTKPAHCVLSDCGCLREGLWISK